MKVLVLRGGALGDFIVTLPMLGLLRARWPDAEIVLVGNARAAALGQLGGYLHSVHSQHEARWAALYDSAPLPSDLAAWLATFDLVVNFWPDPESEIARRFPTRAGQVFLSGAAMPTVAPAARHYCAALRPLGLATDDFRSRLALPSPGLFAPATAAPIAIHPGSGSPQKNWPLTRWAELCSRLQTQSPLLIVGGEADSAAVTALATYGTVVQNLPLPELAARVAASRLFLGHDSGVSHLAAAVGTCCVLLFGPTAPEIWAPPGEHVHVLRRTNELATLTVEEVFMAARVRLDSPSCTDAV
ncbi:MAG: glycosyltransferase family 9 protein [Opitutae bacterium]|nr:glycosyltransferase family 9 protein [Opitutae bacterium]